MHGAMVFMDGHKMSKSLGNLVFVDKLRTEFDPRAIRLAIIEHHYRRDWEWHPSLMEANTERLAAWSACAGAGDAGLLDEVRAALDDDLDTPTAVAAIDAAAAGGRAVGDAAALLGVDLDAVELADLPG
jgi:L-cysteine:1D-myo-inositol 2-amino-2-deoxy-alpha-D-glucopyranoside ligase